MDGTYTPLPTGADKEGPEKPAGRSLRPKTATEPLVSIIVPTYNVERYIGRCLDSILGQTYRNLEILPVDDGATDRSGDILDEYARKDARIRVIHRETNGGRIAVRRTGLVQAKGDYLFFVDADDWIEPQAVELLVRRAMETGADVTVGPHRHVSDEGTVRPSPFLPGPWLYDRDTYARQIMHHRVSASLCVKLYRKQVLTPEMFGFSREYSAGEDYVINCGSLKNITRAAGIAETVYNYYDREDSICHTFVPRVSYYLNLFQLAEEHMGKEWAERYALHHRRFGLRTCLDIVYSELYGRDRTYAGTPSMAAVQGLARQKELTGPLPFRYRVKARLILHPGLLHFTAHLWQFARYRKRWRRYAQVEQA